MGSDIRKTIGIFSPNLDGPFQGELVNQVRQLCALKNYSFVCFQTCDFGTYDFTTSIEALDGAIIIRNAITAELANKLLSMSIPAVSVAYDYFPLDIPLISSDHYKGTELAFRYLIEKGHSDIAFIGDLSNFDLRKRYEAFCELSETEGMDVDDALLYVVQDTSLVSGFEACKEFINRSCNATGIICGSGLTGIGFHQYLKSIKDINANNFEIIIFDSIPMTPTISPEIATIDQNILLMAHKSLEVIGKLIARADTKRINDIEPKLIPPITENDTTRDSYLATCVELTSLYNANYMKSVLSSFFEWSTEIVDTKLDQLMIISPLFSNFMGMCTLSRIMRDKQGNEAVVLMKKYYRTSIQSFEKSDKNAHCKICDFPQKLLSQEEKESYRSCFHFEIRLKDIRWGLLSVFGENNISPETPSNFFAFVNYMETISKFLGDKLEHKYLSGLKSKSAKTIIENDEAVWKKSVIKWDKELNIAIWSEEALEMIGFTSNIEKNIYKNMDITDRFEGDDEEMLRKQFLYFISSDSPISFQGTIKLKSNNFAPAKIETSGSNELKENQSPIVLLNLSIKV